MSKLLSQVERSIISKRLFRRGQSILVGVSGGLDSMVLLHILNQLSVKHRWRLIVAHYNHQLRGDDSDADEQLVVESSKRFHLRIKTGRGDVAGFAQNEKLSVEMAARRLRHEFFVRTAVQLRIKVIALAHHADDQVELFFLRLLRGAGGTGLAGMKWQNHSPSKFGIRLARPLLDQSKGALLEFARQEGIVYREDASNIRTDIQRNFIRRELLPMLTQKYQPALARNVLRLMEVIGEETNFVAEAAREWLNDARRSTFEKLHVAVQRQCLKMQLFDFRIEPDFNLIEQIRCQPGKPVMVNPALTIIRDRAGEVHVQRAESPEFNSHRIQLDLSARNGTLVFDDVKVHWRIIKRRTSGSLQPKRSIHCEHFDADKIGSPILLRHWQPGDRFQPIGMKNSVKLQDFLVNRKIARAQRHRLIVAVAANGEIFWIEGQRISESFKLDKQSIRPLKWRWQRRPSGQDVAKVATRG